VSFEQHKLHSLYFERGASLITMKKHVPEFKMDFNAIAQGLSVDVLYTYIEAKGYKNFFVEIGGELKVKGKNKDGVKWKIAIDSPIENLQQRQLDTVVHISNRGIATSGNYRKFYVKDGVKYSHTLNPKTGKPVTHSLLSATVIADKCSSADGYATAFMVMGTEEALHFVKQHPALKLEVYLLYADEKGEIQHRMSDGFSNYLK
jgi:thiamine biosynthesis lipoprotein